MFFPSKWNEIGRTCQFKYAFLFVIRTRSIHSFDTRNVSEIVHFIEIKSKKEKFFFQHCASAKIFWIHLKWYLMLNIRKQTVIKSWMRSHNLKKQSKGIAQSLMHSVRCNLYIYLFCRFFYEFALNLPNLTRYLCKEPGS